MHGRADRLRHGERRAHPGPDAAGTAPSARERRGLTRQHFGDLVGRSPSWVDKIEKGERPLDRLSVLDTIAQAPAIEAAGRIDPSRLMMLPKERRANHLLDVALAYSLGGKRDEALWSLLEADELAPREIRCRPVARDLIADLVRRARNRPSLELQRLAARAGVPA
jgi:transcriptional regulator with XRE-family HTH domain